LDTLDEMGRVLVLQSVPMFAGLDPEDLLLIARAVEEKHYDDDELIYEEGAVGTELLVIVSGDAVVSRTRDGERQVIQTYADGEHVGELSLLHGRERSADVHSGPHGVHGLVLSKADLLSILEERPSVALGMLGTLAQRLVEQT
jgi:CRP-like cAMP-binding protein